MVTMTTEAFAPEKGEITAADIAKQIRGLKPRALTQHEFDDVLTIIEWLKQDVLRRWDENQILEQRLAEREAKLSANQTALAVRQRAVEAVMLAAPQPPKRRLWR